MEGWDDFNYLCIETGDLDTLFAKMTPMQLRHRGNNSGVTFLGGFDEEDLYCYSIGAFDRRHLEQLRAPDSCGTLIFQGTRTLKLILQFLKKLEYTANLNTVDDVKVKILDGETYLLLRMTE